MKMPREAEPSVNERSFILQALRENVRVDGRAFDQFRSLDIYFGDEYGNADVQLGRTRSIAIFRGPLEILLTESAGSSLRSPRKSLNRWLIANLTASSLSPPSLAP